MASQNIARLGVVLGLDSGELVQELEEAQRKFKKFSNEIKRDTNDAAKATIQLEEATRAYGKTLTKVEEVQIQIETGKFKFATETAKKALLEKAAAYDKVAAAAKKANEAAMTGTAKGGLTAQQQAALGYQTTDIITSLAGGQNPLMVLLQQGGQLRDQFGGFKPMFAGIAEALTPVRLAVAGVGGAVLGLGFAMYKGYEESKQFNNSLILTGNISGMTRSKFEALASAVSEKYNYSIFQTREAIQALVSSGRVTGEVVGPAAEAIAKLSRLSGETADVVAKELIPSLDGTAVSAKNLNDKYHFLTFEQYKHIEALERSGQKQKAAVETIELLNKSLNRQQEQIGIIEELWDKATNAVKGYIQALKDLGKEESDDKILERLKNRMEYLRQADQSFAPNAEAYERSREAYLAMLRKMESDKTSAEKKAKDQAKEDEKTALYAKIGGAQKFIDLKKQLEEMAAEEDYQRRAYGLQKIDQLEFKAAEEKRKYAAEQIRLMEQEGYMTRAQRIDLIAAKTRAVDAQLAREREDLYKESRKFFEEKAISEEKSIDDERARLSIYRENLTASQQDLDIAMSRLKVQQDLVELSRRENMNTIDREVAADRIKKLGEQREALILQREELKKLQDMNQAVFSNMGSAIDNFVRTGKLSFKSLAQSIIQDLIAISLKAQMMQIFKGFKFPWDSGGVNIGTQTGADMMMAFADGGNPPVGVPSIVGEEGPEIFVPREAGTILPNKVFNAMSTNQPQVVYNGPYIANMSAIDTQSATQFLAKNKSAVYAANQSASRSMSTSR